MSTLITLEQARDILNGNRMASLVTLLGTAFKGWKERSSPAFDSTTRARAMSNLFYFEAQVSLAADSGFYYGESNNQRFITFDDRVLLRFKLLNKALESSNYPTDQADEFVHQAMIDGFPPFDRIHFGYRLNITGLEILDAFVALPVGIKGNFNAWVWQVLGSPIDTSTYGWQMTLRDITEPMPLRYAYDDYSKYLG